VDKNERRALDNNNNNNNNNDYTQRTVMLFCTDEISTDLSEGGCKLRGLNLQANYTDERPPLVGEVSANFCE
jgi:hypothetical protein